MADQSPKAELESKMAFVVGYTGETGKTLVKELLQRKVFKKLILIGRRQVKLDGDLYKDTVSPLVGYIEASRLLNVFFFHSGRSRELSISTIWTNTKLHSRTAKWDSAA